MTTMSNSSSHEDAASISGVARTSRDALNEAVEDIKQNLGENSDEGYRQFLELLLQERDSVSFGKRASIMDFVKAGAIYSEETGQTPSRSRPLVKEVLGGIMTKLPDQDRVRWIHLPANNMFWVEGLMRAIYERDPNGDMDRPSHDRTIMSTKYWSGHQNSDSAYRHHARFMRPTCLKLPADAYDGTTDEKEADMVFFMPYLHWESDVVRLHTNYIMEDVDKGSQYTDEELLKLPCNVDEKLLRKYLRNSSPLHVRRTLDQAYYYTLPSTLDRDSDQVVFRYLKRPEEINPPVLMVDQCWLWVLGGCWIEERELNPKDPIDLLERIVRDVQEKTTYQTISTPLDLAAIILEHCAGNVVDDSLEKRREHDRFHFLEWFRRSIRRLMADQTDLFASFCGDSEKLQNRLKLMILSIRTLPALPSVFHRWDETFEELQEPSAGGLFDITKEIANLKEIKDISDELYMIEDVLNQQKKALNMFENVAGGKKQWEQLARKLQQRVEERRGTIEQLKRDAKHTYQWILDLLDLKQKQANVSAALYGRFQADLATKQAAESVQQTAESAQQGRSIMLFTSVTILFLPLSSLASIFGLNARELNGGNLSFGIVSAYLFPLSLLFVVVAFLLAFHTGARQFFTLYVRLIFAYIDQLTGFSMAMSEDRVRGLEAKPNNIKTTRSGERKVSARARSFPPRGNGNVKEQESGEKDVAENYRSKTGEENGEASGSRKEGFWQRVRKWMHSPAVKKAKVECP